MIVNSVDPNILRNALEASRRNDHKRRGVLLLVTVCMLTLFLMLGTAYLVAASRARESANAIARKALFADQTNYRPETYLDNVLMQIVRGGNAPTALPGDPTVAFESLLEDRYGSNFVIGEITNADIFSSAGSGNSGPVLTVQFAQTGGSIGHVSELNGRILTFIVQGRPVTSHRIIRASGSYTLALTNPRGPHQLQAGNLPPIHSTSSPSLAIINGRDFTGLSGDANEAWDGFDAQNPFLANIEPDSSSVGKTTVNRPSYHPGSSGPPSGANSIDNDGDGEPDSFFMDWGLPSLPTANGTINLHASALIVDLDGRFNANVHGSLASMPIRQGSATVEMYSSLNKWPGATGHTQPSDRASINTELRNVPLGSGIGVAEVNPNHVFSTPALNASAALDANNEPVLGDEPQINEQVGGLFTTGGQALNGRRPTTGRFSASSTPRIGNIEGRYGGFAANLDAIQNQVNSPSFSFSNSTDNNMMANPGANGHVRQAADSILQAYGVPSSNWFTGSHDAYGSPPDVFGRMKFLTRRPIQEFEDINGNGVLDNEDTNSDGSLNPGEDTNGNGVLDNEDADGNGVLTSASDLDGSGADDTYGLVPRPTFAKAEWSNELAASPYSSRLISMGSRGGLNHAPSTDGTSSVATRSTNPFTLAELETILRPYDIDSQQLPMRLTAMLGTVAEYMRTAITTESWDTTGIVDGSVLDEDTNNNGVLDTGEDLDANGNLNYYHEDANGNGVLDGGEDINGNGDLDLWGAWGLIKHNMALLPSTTATLYNNNDPLRGSFGGEISRGEKFDLNRPLSTTQPSTYNANHPYYLQRQAYFKDLYTLLILLSNLSEDINGNGLLDSGEDLDGNGVLNFFDEEDTNGNGILEAAEDLNGDGVRQSKKILAQWAANVVEFRDADSTMTPFEYDTDLTNGWQCNGNVSTIDADRGETIWGAERPEILITSGVGWEQSTTGGSSSDFGEIYIGLHRPWNSDALNGPSGSRINAMLPDEDFDAAGSENIDISKMSQDGTNPIWRFRLEDTVGGTSTTVPIILPVVADLDSAYPPAGTKSPWAKAALLGVDDWLGVRLAELPQAGMLTFAPRLGRDHDNPSADITRDSELEIFNVSLPGAPATPGQDRVITVHLERLDCLNRNTTAPTMAPTDGYSGSTVGGLTAARYLAVDSMEITIVNRDPFPTGPPAVVPTATDVARVENKRLVGSPSNQEFWRKASPPNGTGSPATYRTSPSSPGLLASPPPALGVVTAPTQAHSNISAFPWPNRPFNSIVELFLIPHDSPSQLLENYRTLLTGPVVHDVPNTLLLDAVRIPTFFAGVNDSWSDPSNNLRSETGIDMRINPVNQLSSYREPGRVNLNTITNDQTWDAVVAGPLPVEDVNRNGTIDAGEVDYNGNGSLDGNPIIERRSPRSGFTGPVADLDQNPLKSGANILAMGSPGSPVLFDNNGTFLNSIDVARNPQHRLYTAGRFANTATVRSNLFAVWVTLRESISGDPDSVKYHRAFYIIDRSIPVCFQAGEDHNVKDTIRLRRIIE